MKVEMIGASGRSNDGSLRAISLAHILTVAAQALVDDGQAMFAFPGSMYVYRGKDLIRITVERVPYVKEVEEVPPA